MKSHFELIDLLTDATPDKNCILSDLSIMMAMALALEGAEGETKQQLESYFGENQKGIRHALKHFIDCMKTQKDAPFLLANAVFCDHKIQLKVSFSKNVKTYLNSDAFSLNFKDESTPDIINHWCSNKTKGALTHSVDQNDLTAGTALLLNVLYFKNCWDTKFDIESTQKAIFHGTQRESPVDMMSGIVSEYFESEAVIGFIKNYQDDCIFIGLLPKEKDFCFSNIDLPRLLKTVSYDYTVHIQIPKFKISYQNDLTDALKQLNLTVPFDPNLANFFEMSDDPLYLSHIIHHSGIEVDEDGTEALAFTEKIVKVFGFSSNEKPQKHIYLNRPFGFIIYNAKWNTLLFAGKINNL